MTADRVFASRRAARCHATGLARSTRWVRLPWVWQHRRTGAWHVGFRAPLPGTANQVHVWPEWAWRQPLRECNVCGALVRLVVRCPACIGVAFDVTPARLQSRLRTAVAAGDQAEVDHLLALLRAAGCQR